MLVGRTFNNNILQVCLMSRSWNNVASTHNHPLTVHAHKHRDVVYAQSPACARLPISTVRMRRWKQNEL